LPGGIVEEPKKQTCLPFGKKIYSV